MSRTQNMQDSAERSEANPKSLLSIALEAVETVDGTCPQAGYDQLGKSHFCLDCGRHWYGDVPACPDKDCPFRAALTKENPDD